VKYLCLGYYDEKRFEQLTEADMAGIANECAPLDAELRASGRLVEVGSLALTPDSVSLRPKQGGTMVLDGPYAETKEQIGSYFIIEADDRDEAIRIASLHPAARLNARLGWGVEIRPIEACQVLIGVVDGDR